MATLEEAEDAVAFSSGMAAVSGVFLSILTPGDEVLSSAQIYGGSRGFFENILTKVGCQVTFFDPCGDIMKTLPALVTKRTRAIFFETPSNPELTILDIGLITRIARSLNLITVIDNTLATPYLQHPAILGIDYVIHSATKYISGHGDAIGGVVVGSRTDMSRLRSTVLASLGACLSPFNAWLYLRGLKTLHIRMDHHCRSAEGIALFLTGHRKVKEVFYPGLETHRGHGIAKKQMSGFGGMVSFRLAGRSACRRFLDGLGLCKIGVSLGDAETLAMNAALMFHNNRSDAACRAIGIDPTLIRISTGLEDMDDILEDIEGALKKA
jgi:methionine-gamma-lyase